MKFIDWFSDMNFLWWYVVASSYDSRHEKWMSHSICWDFLHFSFLLQGLKKWEDATIYILQMCIIFQLWTFEFFLEKKALNVLKKLGEIQKYCKYIMNHFIIPFFYWFVIVLLKVLLNFYSICIFGKLEGECKFCELTCFDFKKGPHLFFQPPHTKRSSLSLPLKWLLTLQFAKCMESWNAYYIPTFYIGM